MACDCYNCLKAECISGVDFPHIEVGSDNCSGKLLSIDLEITEACNGACKYCYRYLTEGPQLAAADEISLEAITHIIKVAHKENGLRLIFFVGGEPLMPCTRDKYLGLLNICNKLGIRHITFTNGLNLSRETAQELRDHWASVCVKLNGMTAEVHDKLVGISDAFERSTAGINYLLECGYGNGNRDLMLAIETVVTADNYDQLDDLWLWARERGIMPSFEKMVPAGRAKKHFQNLYVSNDMLLSKFLKLKELDGSRFGLDWDVTNPIVAGHDCCRFFSSLHIRANGTVYASADVDIQLGDLHRQDITEIISSPESRLKYRLSHQGHSRLNMLSRMLGPAKRARRLHRQ